MAKDNSNASQSSRRNLSFKALSFGAQVGLFVIAMLLIPLFATAIDGVVSSDDEPDQDQSLQQLEVNSNRNSSASSPDVEISGTDTDEPVDANSQSQTSSNNKTIIKLDYSTTTSSADDDGNSNNDDAGQITNSSLTVNGQPIELDDDGDINERIRTEDGDNDIDIRIRTDNDTRGQGGNSTAEIDFEITTRGSQ